MQSSQTKDWPRSRSNVFFFCFEALSQKLCCLLLNVYLNICRVAYLTCCVCLEGGCSDSFPTIKLLISMHKSLKHRHVSFSTNKQTRWHLCSSQLLWRQLIKNLLLNNLSIGALLNPCRCFEEASLRSCHRIPDNSWMCDWLVCSLRSVDVYKNLTFWLKQQFFTASLS